MFAAHYWDVPEARTQHAAFQQATEDDDAGGTGEEIVRAIRYFASGSVNGSILVNGEDSDLFVRDANLIPRRLSEYALNKFLNEGHIVLISRGEYGGIVRLNAHASVVVGYEYINGIQLYLVYDPWPEMGFEIGSDLEPQYYWVTYDWLVDGRQNTPEKEADHKLWDGYVVIETDYCESYLPPAWET